MAREKSQTSGELIPVPETSVSALTPEMQAEIDALVADDLKRGGFDLPAIEIVHAAQVFKFPGEENPIGRFSGFLLGEHRFNVYWEKRGDNEAGNVPPDCVSKDCGTASRGAELYDANDPKTGEVIHTSIYGKCSTCWFNQFGSAANGRGKACANKSHLMIWPEKRDAKIPYLLTVSSTALSGGVQSLAQSEIRNEAMAVYNSPQIGTLAEFWLEKKQDGQKVWSVLHAKVIGGIGDGRGTVNPAEWPKIKGFVKTFMPQLSDAPVNGDEQMTDAEVVAESVAVGAPMNKFEEAKQRAAAVNVGDQLPY